jgi:hypothetical protein
MTRGAQEALIERAQRIGQRSYILGSRVIKPNTLHGIDYLSIFTRGQSEHEELSVAAAALGAKVYEKRGGVYRIEDEDIAQTLPSRIIRVSEPADTQLNGCADIITADFELTKRSLLAAGYHEKPKSFDDHDYTIIEVADPDLGIAIYLPSEPITRIMGII